MKIDEAIKIKEAHLNHKTTFDYKKLDEADRLATEALKLYKELRGTKLIGEHYRLRGETEED